MKPSITTNSRIPPLAIIAALCALLCLGLIIALVGSLSDASKSEQTGVLYSGLVLAASCAIGLAGQLPAPSIARRVLNALSGVGVAISIGLFWRYAPAGEVPGIIAAASFTISILLQLATKKPFRSALIASALVSFLILLVLIIKERPYHILSWEILGGWMMIFLLAAPLSVLSITWVFERSLRNSRV